MLIDLLGREEGRRTGIVRLSTCQEAVESPMSPDRRGVGCDGDVLEKRTIAKKKKLAEMEFAEKKAAKKKVAKKNVAKKKLAATGNKTSPSVACVRNLGNSPRVPGACMGADHVRVSSFQLWRNERRSRPTHQRIMSLLSMAVVLEERSAFRKRFWNARSQDVDRAECCEFLCQTPITVIAKAFGCKPFRLRSAADMSPESRLQSEFRNAFYVMDVVLSNRAPSPAVVNGDHIEGVKSGGGQSCDAVRLVLLCNPEDIGPGMDFYTGLQFCSYLSVVCSTVTGTVTLGMPACRAH